MNIPFNKPYCSGNELEYIRQSIATGKISGDGMFTIKCHQFFETTYGFHKVLLTTSCTDALEMCAILLDIKPGDEIIMPSFTFVSTANAFALRGASIVFADSGRENPNVDPALIEPLITQRTKAIVPVHYAGIACDMDAIMAMASHHSLAVVEDAAQALASSYNGKPLGSIGALSAFSFHETKNIIAGEGGMIVVNDDRFAKRAEIIREKGTNRSAFFRGEVDKYGWVDIGSSYLPSDIVAAYLFAQLEKIDEIQSRRTMLWRRYHQALNPLAVKGKIQLAHIPAYATNNAHMFYLVCQSLAERTELINTLKNEGILSVFHYQSLHRAPFSRGKHDGRSLPQAGRYTDCLLRLPMFYELREEDVDKISDLVLTFYRKR